MKKKISVVLIILGIALAVLIVIRVIQAASKPESGGQQRGGAGNQQRSQGPVVVQVAPVTIGPIQEVREFTGSIRPSYSYVLSAKVGGRLVKLTKRIGDYVKTGESVGTIDDTEYRSAQSEAQALVRVGEASILEAQVQVKHLQREHDRVAGLLDKGIATQAEFDALATQLEAARSKLLLAEAQLAQRQAAAAQAQTRVDYTVLRTFQPGFVAARHTDGGALLSVGSQILTIVGIDTVYVEIAVTERDYANLALGQKAIVQVEGIPSNHFNGFVSRIAPQFQTSSRTAIAEIMVVNDSLLLRPGMFARLQIALAHSDTAHLVPTAALFNRDGTFYLYRLTDSSTVQRLSVAAGISSGELTQIVSPAGLTGMVVTLGQHLLADGTRVMTERQEASAGKKRQPSNDSSGAKKGARKNE